MRVNTGILLCCTGAIYYLKMEGLLLGPVRARLPGPLNLARAWESRRFLSGLPVALGYESIPLGDPAGPLEENGERHT